MYFYKYLISYVSYLTLKKKTVIIIDVNDLSRNKNLTVSGFCKYLIRIAIPISHHQFESISNL